MYSACVSHYIIVHIGLGKCILLYRHPKIPVIPELYLEVSSSMNCFPPVTLDKLVFKLAEQQATNCLVRPCPWRLYSSWYCIQVMWKSSHFSLVSSSPTVDLGNFSVFFPPEAVLGNVRNWLCWCVISLHVVGFHVHGLPDFGLGLDHPIRVKVTCFVLAPHKWSITSVV